MVIIDRKCAECNSDFDVRKMMSADGFLFCVKCYDDSILNETILLCNGCEKVLYFGAKHAVYENDHYWHDSCLRTFCMLKRIGQGTPFE